MKKKKRIYLDLFFGDKKSFKCSVSGDKGVFLWREATATCGAAVVFAGIELDHVWPHTQCDGNTHTQKEREITLLCYSIPSNLCCCLKRDQVISNRQVIVCGSTQRQAPQIYLSPAYTVCSSGSASFASCLPRTHNSFTLADSPQQTWQMLRIQFKPQKLKIIWGGGGGGATKANSIWRCMQFTLWEA